MDAVREDMQVAGVRVEDTENRLKWKAVWQTLKRDNFIHFTLILKLLFFYFLIRDFRILSLGY